MHETPDALKQSLLDLDMDGALTQARSIVAGAAGVSAQDGVNAIAEARRSSANDFRTGIERDKPSFGEQVNRQGA